MCWVWSQLEQGIAFPGSSGTISGCTVLSEHQGLWGASEGGRHQVPLPREHHLHPRWDLAALSEPLHREFGLRALLKAYLSCRASFPNLNKNDVDTHFLQFPALPVG